MEKYDHLVNLTVRRLRPRQQGHRPGRGTPRRPDFFAFMRHLYRKYQCRILLRQRLPARAGSLHRPIVGRVLPVLGLRHRHVRLGRGVGARSTISPPGSPACGLATATSLSRSSSISSSRAASTSRPRSASACEGERRLPGPRTDLARCAVPASRRPAPGHHPVLHLHRQGRPVQAARRAQATVRVEMMLPCGPVADHRRSGRHAARRLPDQQPLENASAAGG